MQSAREQEYLYCSFRRHHLDELSTKSEENEIVENVNNGLCEYKLPELLDCFESNMGSSEKNSLKSYVDDGVSSVYTKGEENRIHGREKDTMCTIGERSRIRNMIDRKWMQKGEFIGHNDLQRKPLRKDGEPGNIIIVKNEGQMDDFEEILSRADLNDEAVEKKLNDYFYQFFCKSIADVNTNRLNHQVQKMRYLKKIGKNTHNGSIKKKLSKRDGIHVEHIDYGEIILMIYDKLHSKENTYLSPNKNKRTRLYIDSPIRRKSNRELRRTMHTEDSDCWELQRMREEDGPYYSNRNYLKNAFMDKNLKTSRKKKVSFYFKKYPKSEGGVEADYGANLIECNEYLVKDRTLLKNFYIRKNREVANHFSVFDNKYHEMQMVPQNGFSEKLKEVYNDDHKYERKYAKQRSDIELLKKNVEYKPFMHYNVIETNARKDKHIISSNKEEEEVNREIEKEENREIERKVNIGIEKEENREIEKDVNGEIEKEENREIEKEENREIEKEENREIEKEENREIEKETNIGMIEKENKEIVEENIEKEEENERQYLCNKKELMHVSPHESNVILEEYAKSSIEEKKEKEAGCTGKTENLIHEEIDVPHVTKYINENKTSASQAVNESSNDKTVSNKNNINNVTNIENASNVHRSSHSSSHYDEEYFDLLLKQYDQTKLFEINENIIPELDEINEISGLNEGTEGNQVHEINEMDPIISVKDTQVYEEKKEEETKEKEKKNIISSEPYHVVIERASELEKEGMVDQMNTVDMELEAERRVEVENDQNGYDQWMQPENMKDLHNMKIQYLDSLTNDNCEESKNILRSFMLYTDMDMNDDINEKLDEVNNLEEKKTDEVEEECVEEISFFERLKKELTNKITLNLSFDPNEQESADNTNTTNNNNNNEEAFSFDMNGDIHYNEDFDMGFDNMPYRENVEHEECEDNRNSTVKYTTVGKDLRMSDLNDSRMNQGEEIHSLRIERGEMNDSNEGIIDPMQCSQYAFMNSFAQTPKKDMECQTDFPMDLSKSMNRTPRKKWCEVKLVDKTVPQNQGTEPNRRYPKRNRIKPLKFWIGEREITERNPETGNIDVVGIKKCKNKDAVSPHILGPFKYDDPFLKGVIKNSQIEEVERSDYDTEEEVRLNEVSAVTVSDMRGSGRFYSTSIQKGRRRSVSVGPGLSKKKRKFIDVSNFIEEKDSMGEFENDDNNKEEEEGSINNEDDDENMENKGNDIFEQENEQNEEPEPLSYDVFNLDNGFVLSEENVPIINEEVCEKNIIKIDDEEEKNDVDDVNTMDHLNTSFKLISDSLDLMRIEKEKEVAEENSGVGYGEEKKKSKKEKKKRKKKKIGKLYEALTLQNLQGFVNRKDAGGGNIEQDLLSFYKNAKNKRVIKNIEKRKKKIKNKKGFGNSKNMEMNENTSTKVICLSSENSEIEKMNDNSNYNNHSSNSDDVIIELSEIKKNPEVECIEIEDIPFSVVEEETEETKYKEINREIQNKEDSKVLFITEQNIHSENCPEERIENVNESLLLSKKRNYEVMMIDSYEAKKRITESLEKEMINQNNISSSITEIIHSTNYNIDDCVKDAFQRTFHFDKVRFVKRKKRNSRILKNSNSSDTDEEDKISLNNILNGKNQLSVSLSFPLKNYSYAVNKLISNPKFEPNLIMIPRDPLNNYRFQVDMQQIILKSYMYFYISTYKSDILGFIDKGEKIKIYYKEEEKELEKGDFFYIPKYSEYVIINDNNFRSVIFICSIKR